MSSVNLRTIQKIIYPQKTIEGAGVKLIRSIATRTLDYVDPFLLFDHFGSDNPDDYLAGFPRHPHRGIETVTYMLAGKVHHSDSLGNSGEIQAGDVQWMTVGGGIMHEEMPLPVDGKMEGFQLWVNLPAKLKMSRPRYQEIYSSQIPEITTENQIKIRVIAGVYDGVRGPVTEIAINPQYLDIFLPPATTFVQKVETGHAVLAYVFQGEAILGLNQLNQEVNITAPKMVVYNDGEQIQVQTRENAVRFVLISGKPIGESIARFGPFVMNTEEEIEQALIDLRNGTFVRS